MPNSKAHCRSDTMAVGTNDFTLSDLGLSLGNAFCIADVQLLACSDVVKVKRNRVPFKPAVGASLLKLVGIKPIPHLARPLIGLMVDLLAVARRLQPTLPPHLHLLRCKLSFWARPLSTLVRAEPCRTLGFKASSTLDAGEVSRQRLGPWGHVDQVPSVAFPCKPDIFALTYEATQERGMASC
jgi:hypothetical protein